MPLATGEQRREPPSFCEQSGGVNSWQSLAPECRPATECGAKALELQLLQRIHDIYYDDDDNGVAAIIC